MTGQQSAQAALYGFETELLKFGHDDLRVQLRTCLVGMRVIDREERFDGIRTHGLVSGGDDVVQIDEGSASASATDFAQPA